MWKIFYGLIEVILSLTFEKTQQQQQLAHIFTCILTIKRSFLLYLLQKELLIYYIKLTIVNSNPHDHILFHKVNYGVIPNLLTYPSTLEILRHQVQPRIAGKT